MSIGSAHEERFSPENRQRLSGPGLRTFLALAAEWSLSEDQQIRILGMPLVGSFQLWCRQARAGKELCLSLDVLMRLSAVIGIYGSLHILHEKDEERQEWLRGPHGAFPFNGQPPLALITSGSLDELMAVRRFLEAAQQGLYMESGEIDKGFEPSQDEDIHWA